MSEGVGRKRNDRELCDLATRIVSSIGEALGSAAKRPVRVSLTGDVACVDVEGWIWMLNDPIAVMRGAFEQTFAGQNIRIALAEKEAILLCEHVFQITADVPPEETQAESLGWRLETFREIGGAVCQNIHRLLRATLGAAVSVALDGVGTARPGFDDTGILGTGEKFFYGFTLQTDDKPATTGWLVLDDDLARQWNNGEDVFVDSADGEPNAEETPETLEEIPQAPVRGRLTVFLTGSTAVRVLRQCARRIGFEIDARPETEVPNPAAFSDETLLIEIPAHGEKRLDWAKRVKQQNASARVVLLLHEPSRANVMSAIQTKADVLVAWPIAEPELSIKLEPMFPI